MVSDQETVRSKYDRGKAVQWIKGGAAGENMTVDLFDFDVRLAT